MAEHAAANKDAAPAAGKSSKVKVAIILGVIVAVQCVLALLFFPTGGGAAAVAEPATEKTATHADAHGHGHAHAPQGPEIREVDLGQFSLTLFNPTANATMLVDFHLYGTVDAEPEVHDAKKEEAGGHGGHGGHGEKKPAAGDAEEVDNTKFGRLFKKAKHRFRDQVIVVVRNAELSDLADPGLALIKRQVLTKTNSLLGEPLLKEVIFSDFAIVEQ